MEIATAVSGQKLKPLGKPAQNSHAKPKKEMKPIPSIVIPEGRSHTIKALIDAYFLPEIGEILSQLSTYDLLPWQRSCQWARKTAPARICHPPSPGVGSRIWKRARDITAEARELLAAGKQAERTESELRALATFPGNDPEELGIETLLGRIAALSLYERTKWGRKNRKSIVNESLSSAEMSYYLAAAIQPFTEEWTSLINAMLNLSSMLICGIGAASFTDRGRLARHAGKNSRKASAPTRSFTGHSSSVRPLPIRLNSSSNFFARTLPMRKPAPFRWRSRRIIPTLRNGWQAWIISRNLRSPRESYYASRDNSIKNSCCLRDWIPLPARIHAGHINGSATLPMTMRRPRLRFFRAWIGSRN